MVYNLVIALRVFLNLSILTQFIYLLDQFHRVFINLRFKGKQFTFFRKLSKVDFLSMYSSMVYPILIVSHKLF